MKKIYTLIIFLTLFIFTNVHSVEKRSGHTIIGSEGNVLYYSLKQKRYISCKAFVLEGGRLNVSGYTVIPNCDKGDLSLSNLEGVKTFDSSKYDKYIVDNKEIDFTDGTPINSNGEPAKLKVQEIIYGYRLTVKDEDGFTITSRWNGKEFLHISDWENEHRNNSKIDTSKISETSSFWHATCIDVNTKENFRCPPYIVKEFYKNEKSRISALMKYFQPSKTMVTKKKSRDVKGKKLFCYWNNEPISGFGIEFNRNSKAKLRAIDDESEKLFTINGTYQALSNKITIKYKNLDNSDNDMTINRKTLKIRGASRSSCKSIAKSSSIENKLKLALDKFISEKSSENKF